MIVTMFEDEKDDCLHEKSLTEVMTGLFVCFSDAAICLAMPAMKRLACYARLA
jgi:hypothetical protein